MLVSVIVPVYNIENQISRCLKSLLEQKYKKYEIIVINDGSNDNSLEKIKQISSRKIKVFTTENNGLGAARNFGLTKAQGEFVCFVDGDDCVEPYYLENMAKFAKKGFDIIVCDYNLVFINKSGINPLKKIANKLVSPRQFKGIDEKLILNYRYLAWNKMYRKELLKNFKWGNGAHEDICALALLFKNPKIKYIQDKLYNYYKRNNTLSTSTTSVKIQNIRQNYNYVLKYANNYYDIIMLRQYSSLLVNIVDLYKDNKEMLKKQLNNLNSEFSKYATDKKILNKLGLAKKKYVEAGLKKDINRLLFINKFVSK